MLHYSRPSCLWSSSTERICKIPLSFYTRYDFYIVSQAVHSGSVSPTHYNVIYDSSGLKPDHMQRLTYKLCHMYYNWQVCVCVCVHLHLLASHCFWKADFLSLGQMHQDFKGPIKGVKIKIKYQYVEATLLILVTSLAVVC